MYMLLIKFKERLLTFTPVCVGLVDKMYRKQKTAQARANFIVIQSFSAQLSKYTSAQQQQSF